MVPTQRNITEAWLRTLGPPATGRLEIWDEHTPGLILRITAAGTFTWSIRTRTTDGKFTRPKLGTYPAVGLAEARKRATATRADIQGGGDPVAERRTTQAARVVRAGLPTVAARLAEWQDAKAGDWSTSYAREVKRLTDREIVPKIGKLPLADTTRAHWSSLIATKRRSAKAVASALYRLASSFLGHAEAHGWVVPPRLLPRKGLTALAPASQGRARVLTDAELLAVWQATDDLTPRSRAFVRLLIITGAREREVADIATGEVDRTAARWTIPAERAKNRRRHTLPLSRLALDCIEGVWPKHGDRAGPTHGPDPARGLPRPCRGMP